MGAKINTIGWRPTYYRARTLDQGRRLVIDNIHIMSGKSIFIPRGWDRGMAEGLKPEEIDRSGNIFIANGQFTPQLENGQPPQNYKGQMLGRVLGYDEAGNAQALGTIPLGNYIVQDRASHLQAIVEITPSSEPGKLAVVERRLDMLGLPEDRSKYVYTLTQAGTRMLLEQVVDYRWITDVRVDKNHVEVVYRLPSGAVRSTRLPAIAFRDNDDKALLKNCAANMSRVDDLYQSQAYVRETERFKPAIDEMHGQLRLIVHKVKRYDIPAPKGVKFPANGQVKIFPASADAAAKINGQWIPLDLAEPLFDHMPEACLKAGLQIENAEVTDELSVDLKLSQVNEGQIKQAIGPQSRFGEPNNISSEYVRDPYFYGLTMEAMFRTIERYGEQFAINRGKAVRAFRGIESGRSHVMPYTLLFNAFADILPTNNQYLGKLANFAEDIWGPGVSEDTQMEMAYWLKGLKMWVVKELVVLIAAEKEWGRYNTQNTQRYNFSEVLFNLSFMLSKIDVLEARVLGRKPVLMSWAEMSEITAGRTWYKMPHAKILENLTIPIYLLSLGHVLFYPVDLTYFIGAWLFRTVASSVNYTRHLTSLGYGFLTGFWKNPALELTMMGGYARAAWKQFLERNQYGTFALTVGGSGDLIPSLNRNMVRGFALTTGTSLAFTTVMLTLGGAAAWLALPFGLAAIPLGLSLFAKGMGGRHGRWGKFVRAAGGGALVLGGATAAALGAPVLFTSALSVALIANMTFGLYSLGLLGRAISDIRKATREDEILKREKAKQPTNKQILEAEHELTLVRIQQALRAGKQHISYEELHEKRENLRSILKDIDALDAKGRQKQGAEHPYRFEIFRIKDCFADIEATIAKKACADLANNTNLATAREALLDILRTSHEYVIIDFVAKMYRRFGFQL